MNDLKKILSRLIGNNNILSNNILFIDFTGSHEKAQFLSQLFYWSSRTKNKDGWVAKKYDDWFSEIRVKEHSIRRFTKEFVEQGFIQTQFKKFNDVPTIHYRLDQDKLIQCLLTFCEGDKLLGSQIVSVEGDKLQASMRVTNCKPPIITETTTDITTETKEEETFVSTTPEVEKVEKVEQPKQPKKETKAEAETTDYFAKVEGLKKKIGPKHYGLLNEVYDVPGMKAKLGQLWLDGKFDILTDFLEHRKDIRKHYPTKKGIVELINNEFQEYTIEELAAGVKKASKGTHQGFYPDRINKPKAIEKEPENYELLNQINVARGGFNIPAQKVA